ncbi:Sugar transferase involved in LPS biosynthesis (colanic, teichoic acid) [Roseovarius azorensis]|uniref:Sugar transferase involved in LPS biosynthesis (Colanic, teichoic acid) n=1 Tax=Roseovarius azorensis TaxID=1287727 RepID=A0A1H7UUN2_9RHOB|nr:sugar transferase [Roseovarius azorensis]SEM00544.1 Sugar transferase involved in LPS biosynthesis (colanic, teichoic acid) [Roseovarius azorensis]
MSFRVMRSSMRPEAPNYIESKAILRSAPNFYARAGKRLLDIVLVLLAAPIILPLLAVLAAVIALDGRSPFFTQERVGRNGRTFRMWKLRSMVVNAEAQLERCLAASPERRLEWDEHQKLRDDPRVTRIGHLIRKTSLDELPQFWNVLRGEMSIVGPRPMLPEQRAFYPGTAYYALRPGITGFWQVSVRNGSSFAERAHYDTNYLRDMSLRTDIRVLFCTIRVVLGGTGC